MLENKLEQRRNARFFLASALGCGVVLAEKLSSAAGFSSLERGWQLIPTEKVKVLESDFMPCCEGRTRDILFSGHIWQN